MSKKILMIYGGIVLLVIVVGIAIYMLKNESKIQNVTSTQVKQLTVDGAIEKLKTKGFSVGDKNQVYYQILGAYDGTKLDVNNIWTEIYQFTPAQQEAKTKAAESLSTTNATADSNFFESGSLLVIVHTGDKTFMESVKKALE